MKKMILSIIVLICLVGVVGCEAAKEGNYKEGTYYGHVTDTYDGMENEATAVVYVDETGTIKSVFLDTTYPKENGSTTKKSLSDNNEVNLKWYEQIDVLEKEIVSNQGIDFITWEDKEKSVTNSISGVNIKIDSLYKSLKEALKKAKK